MSSSYMWQKKNEGDTVEWASNTGRVGVFLFRVGPGGKVYNLFEDYPQKLTADELATFNRENPFWVEFFADRLAAMKEL